MGRENAQRRDPPQDQKGRVVPARARLAFARHRPPVLARPYVAVRPLPGVDTRQHHIVARQRRIVVRPHPHAHACVYVSIHMRMSASTSAFLHPGVFVSTCAASKRAREQKSKEVPAAQPDWRRTRHVNVIMCTACACEHVTACVCEHAAQASWGRERLQQAAEAESGNHCGRARQPLRQMELYTLNHRRQHRLRGVRGVREVRGAGGTRLLDGGLGL